MLGCQTLSLRTVDSAAAAAAAATAAMMLLLQCCMQVSAPNPLPAGFQVQFYDMEGFKLSYVMGDMLTLFKVSSQCE
jgi:hypothetical protein